MRLNREETSNNRIRSSSSLGETGEGQENPSRPRPIDRIPGAGAREGTPSGKETTREALARGDPSLEIGLERDVETGLIIPRGDPTASTHNRPEIATRLPGPSAAGAYSKDMSHVGATTAIPASQSMSMVNPTTARKSSHGHKRAETVDFALG